MIGIDTNVIIRFLVRDDPEQSPRAVALFAQLTPEKPGFISTITLAEVVWVLRKSYAIERQRVAEIIGFLADSREIRLEHSETVRQALRLYQEGNAGFSDCLIARIAATHGCDTTVTFDRDAAKSAGMRLL